MFKFNLYLILLPLVALSADKIKTVFETDTATNLFASSTELKQPMVYKLKSKPYIQEEMFSLLSFLSKQGIKINAAFISDTNFVKCCSRDSQQLLFFDRNKCGFYYNDKMLNGFDFPINEDSLSNHSKMLLHALLGIDAKNYSQINTEKEYQILRSDTSELKFVTYRYVRYLDSRPILGNSCSIRLTLGRNLKIKSLTFDVPAIVLGAYIKSKPARSGFIQYITNYIENSKFMVSAKNLKPTTIKVHSLTESYFPVERFGEKLLCPCFSFTATHFYNDSILEIREHHILAEDITKLPNTKVVKYVQ